GYLPFLYDLTDLLVYGEENVIAIRLDNSDAPDVPPGKPQQDLDFTYEGGLYRNIYIHITDKLYITHPILAGEVAGGGIFVTYPKVSHEEADIAIQTHISNEQEKVATFRLVQKLVDEAGQLVQEIAHEYTVAANQTAHFKQVMTIESPTLWHPSNPYLYTLKTAIEVEDREIDSQETVIGVRTFEFTSKGFKLNGEFLKVSGANYHQSGVYVGNALSDNMLRRDAKKLREAGFFHIRSHYPFAPAFMEACDQLGHLVIVSTPGWQWYKEGIFVERVYQNIREMVRWHRNHPSVILWEPILNESNMPDAFQQSVHEIVHEEYPVDPCYTASDYGPTDVAYKEFDLDMLGVQTLENHNPDELKKEIKGEVKPLWIREYGDSPDNWVDQNAAWRVPRSWGEHALLRQVERTLEPEIKFAGTYLGMCTKEHICGFGLWPGIEHNRGYHINPCWGGVFDLYRIPKYSYHFYKSQQDATVQIRDLENGPMVFIANDWGELSPVDITVYSNCEEVRLYHQEELIEVRKPEAISIPHPPFIFRDMKKYLTRERTQIKVEGLIDGEVVAVDSRWSPGVPKKLVLEADCMNHPLEADGSDLLMVYCKVVDEQGNLTTLTADHMPIRFTVCGEAKIIGDESIGANPIKPVRGQCAILVQASKQAGKITIQAALEHAKKYNAIAIEEGYLELESIHADKVFYR
ncbi:MAG: glycoside hydrolase family 2 TIM barrel-domain containing protein, partial [Cellulosilyticaceae bacterium]